MPNLKQRLKETRKDRQLSQAQLGKAAKITQPSVSDLETGESNMMSGDTLVRMAKALKVRAEWLMTGEGPKEEVYKEDEQALIEKYRQASPAWRAAIQNLAGLSADQQDWVLENVLEKVFQPAVPDRVVEQHLPRPKPVHGTITPQKSTVRRKIA